MLRISLRIIHVLIFMSIIFSFTLFQKIKENSNLYWDEGQLCGLLITFKMPEYLGPVNFSVSISSSNPDNYVGPVVEGWEPYVSRDTKKYLNPLSNDFKIVPRILGHHKDWCFNTRLILFHHSRPESFTARLDNRRTWFNFMAEVRDIVAFFVIGIPSGEKSSRIQEKIKMESELYGDILQVNFVDHANNNTLKTLHTYKYLLNLDWQGRYPENIMKCDDDVYINLPLLSDLIFKSQAYRVSRHNKLLGWIHDNSKTLRIPAEKMGKHYAEYLYVPEYIFDGDLYPRFPSGAGYVVPWKFIACLYLQSIEMSIFFIEDVFIGGFVAERCNLERENLAGIHPFGKPIGNRKQKRNLLVHYVGHEEKFDFHKLFTRDTEKE